MLVKGVLIPTLIIAASAIGSVIAWLSGLNVHPAELLTAAAVTLLAAQLAILPFSLAKDVSQVTAFQLAFVGTILHLVISAASGVAIMVFRKPSAAFVVWLIVLYWVSLVGLCLIFIRRLRAPINPTTATAN